MPADASENDDVACVLSAELGEGGFDKVDLGEEDGFKLVADEVAGPGGGGEFFYRADDSCGKCERGHGRGEMGNVRYLQTCNIARYQFGQRLGRLPLWQHHSAPLPGRRTGYP